MSISTTNRKAGPFAGNGVQTNFPFGFKVFAAGDVLVVRADANATETVLVLGADYTVTLNPNQDDAPGGEIVLTAPLAVGLTLAATSDIDALQPVTVTNGGGFFPSVFNGVFDRLTILVQQLLERMTRTMSIPLTASGVTSLQVPVRASAVLQWSADGTQLTAVTLPDLSLSLALPNMAGKAGQFLTNNGAIASWSNVPVLSVVGLTGAITGAALKGALAYTTADLGDWAAASLAIRRKTTRFALNAAAAL